MSVPVVETGYTNLHKLKDIVGTGPEKGGCGGVIMTSARSCEAWKAAVLELVEEGAQEGAEGASESATHPTHSDPLTERTQNPGPPSPSTSSAKPPRARS